MKTRLTFFILLSWFGANAFTNNFNISNDRYIDLLFTPDTIPPVITCPPNINTVTDAASCLATNINLGLATATDNSGLVTISNDAPINFNQGGTLVLWTAIDAENNTSSCFQLVMVTDNQFPTISCPNNITVGPDSGFCYATMVTQGGFSYYDNCGDPNIYTIEPTDTFPAGINVLTWVIIDGNGNSASCLQTVTVTGDSLNPDVSCGIDVTSNSDSTSCSAKVYYPFPSINDNCVDVSLVSFEHNGTTTSWTVPLGVHQIKIAVGGAQGGGFNPYPFGGWGAVMEGIFNVNPGDQLLIFPGGQGQTGYGCGGGGGSFVFKGVTAANGLLLIAAGGGGGAGTECVGNSGAAASTTIDGTSGNSPGGFNGNGGTAGFIGAGGGAGYFSNGGSSTEGGGGTAISNGAFGGFAPLNIPPVYYGGNGGFGGGGSGGNRGGGGGGGYSGGGGSSNFGGCGNGGGGGGSFNSGLWQQDSVGNLGHGWVRITYSRGINLVQTSGLPSGSDFPVGTTTNTFVLTDNFGLADSCSFNVVVNDVNPPVLDCSDMIICDTVVSFTNTAIDNCGIASYVYSIPAGTVLSYGTDTVVEVTVTDLNGNTTTCSFYLSIVAPPVAGTLIASDTLLCSTDDQWFITTVGGSSTPLFEFFDSSDSIWLPLALADTFGFIAIGGAFSVPVRTVFSIGSCTVYSNIITMEWINPMEPSITIAASKKSICSGTNVTFTASVVNSSTGIYQWKKNGLNVGINNFQYSDATLLNNDTIICEYTDNGSYCALQTSVVSNEIKISVNKISIILNPETCPGDGTAELKAVVPNNGPFHFLWSNGATTKIITGVITGTYTVTVSGYGASNCPNLNATKNIKLLNPIKFITTKALPNCSSCCDGTLSGTGAKGGTPPYQYLWSDGNTIGLRNDFCFGNYTLSITDQNGCVATFSRSFSQLSTRFESALSDFEIRLFPNPTTGIFNIALNTFESTDATIEIFNAIGKKIKSSDLTTGDGYNEFQFSLNDVEHGTYFVRIITGNQAKVFPVIHQD